MTFIFWQNIISIHQKSFLEALVKQPAVDKVMLIVEHELTPVRKEMGWDTPTLTGVDTITSPVESEIVELVRSNQDAVHIMGGIRIGRMITLAFDTAIAHKCRVGIMTEPYDSAGVKGILRAAKYRYYARKYFKSIDFVLAIGRQGVQQYQTLGFDRRRLFGWAYFITLKNARSATAHTGPVRIIYAGRLEEAKGIKRFVMDLVASGNRNFKLDIYGAGSDEAAIREVADKAGLAENITITRFIKYQELLELYRNYDWVVLPSTQKDGWGVIVSEGLLNGLKVACSNICGASWVIKDGFNGIVFDWQSASQSCRLTIEKIFGDNSFARPEDISSWAQRTISGEAGAKYFMRVVASVYDNKIKPGVPWVD